MSEVGPTNHPIWVLEIGTHFSLSVACALPFVSFASFVHPYIKPHAEPSIITFPKSSPTDSPDHLAISVMGQSPTALGIAEPLSPLNSDDDGLGETLERIHGCIRGTELDPIIREQPDVREYGLMTGSFLSHLFSFDVTNSVEIQCPSCHHRA